MTVSIDRTRALLVELKNEVKTLKDTYERDRWKNDFNNGLDDIRLLLKTIEKKIRTEKRT